MCDARRRRDTTFAIRFVTRYAYDSEVGDNMNALRVRPAANGRQRVDEFSVRLNPRHGSSATTTTSAPRWSSSRYRGPTGS